MNKKYFNQIRQGGPTDAQREAPPIAGVLRQMRARHWRVQIHPEFPAHETES